MSEERDRAETEKLQAETRLLEQQASPNARRIEQFKAAAGVGGMMTAIVAVGGLLFSFWQFQTESIAKREAYQQERLDHTLALLFDEDPAKQISGVWTLESFIRVSEPAVKRQILAVLVHVLAEEEDKAVRDAIVASFRTPGYADLDEEFQAVLLQQLVAASASLIIEDDLWRTRRGNRETGLPEHSIEARALSIGKAVVALLSSGPAFKRVSGVYCAGCDFSGMALDGVDFSEAILYQANFSGASLIEANFDSADLEETRFVGAKLRGATLTFNDRTREGFYRQSYIFRATNRDRFKGGPNFNCADLRDADFSGHPLFGFIHVAVGPQSWSEDQGASFVGADLEDADFREARFFGKKLENMSYPFPARRGIGRLDDKIELFEFSHRDFAAGWKPPAEYQGSLWKIRQFLSGANWSQAKFSPDMLDWLEYDPPPKLMRFTGGEICKPQERRHFAPELAVFYRGSVEPSEVRQALDSADTGFLIDFIRWSAERKDRVGEGLTEQEMPLLDVARIWEWLKMGRTLTSYLASAGPKQVNQALNALSDLGVEEIVSILKPMSQLLSEKEVPEPKPTAEYQERERWAAEVLALAFDNLEETELQLIRQLETLDAAILDHMQNHREELFSSFRYK